MWDVLAKMLSLLLFFSGGEGVLPRKSYFPQYRTLRLGVSQTRYCLHVWARKSLRRDTAASFDLKGLKMMTISNVNTLSEK